MRKIKFNVARIKNIGTGETRDIPAIKGEGINYDAEIDQLATEIEELNDIKADKTELEDNYYDKNYLKNFNGIVDKNNDEEVEFVEKSDLDLLENKLVEMLDERIGELDSIIGSGVFE